MFISPAHLEAGIAIISLGISIFALKTVLKLKDEHVSFTESIQQQMHDSEKTMKVIEVKLDQIQEILAKITSVQVKTD